MAVQVVENWALIQGKIVAIGPNAELGDYLSATIEVSQVTPIDDYPNLFSWAIGKQITVNIPAAKASELSLAADDKISARVRKSGPTSAFVDPDSLMKTT
ncbi:MAG TPA: hypothetical protein VGN90_07490 [Pyrinomonadaceae bacterium]|nr:hypothetical protein [Pyrinomonadaceae bacterium]